MTNLKCKRIISCAIVGSWPSRSDNPHLPLTPEEIADSAYESWKAGAAIVHIHVRDDEGKAGIEFAKYEETVARIRSHKDCDVCINITSSGTADDMGDEARMLPVRELLPEMCSYDVGSLNWMHNTIFVNHPKFLEKFGLLLQEINVKPELEIFDGGMIYNAIHYMKTGVLQPPCHFQIVLGAPGGLDNSIENLVFLRNLIPEGSTWAACGIGKGHIPIMLATIAMGGHLRVGMEDNVYYRKGVPADSNAQFVARAKRFLEEANLEAATPDEAREILGLVRKVF